MAAIVSLPVSPLHALARRPSLEPLPTGVPDLDRIVGGIPCATMTEIWGAASSGRTSLLHSIVRTAMSRGQYCVWIDTPDSFDPESASSAGIRLSQLLWVRSQRNPEHALHAADLLVRAGGFSLIVLDLSGISMRVSNRIPMASWFRLRHGAEHSGASLLVTGDHPNTGSCAKLHLTLRQDQIHWSNQLLRGTVASARNPKRLQPQPATFATTA